MSIRRGKMMVLLMALVVGGAMFLTQRISASGGDNVLDDQLSMVLSHHGFTGTVGSSMEQRLGRRIDNQLADLGRNLFHDTIVGLNNDNSCSGCHSATAGFGDTQSIAIGVENNFIVGPDRSGPRNQRRTPMAANTALFPTLMWNSRFASLSFDPFDNSVGFMFPLPEGLTLSDKAHLLIAQAFIPPTERVEAAGFVFPGDNFDIRDEVIRRINDVPEYRKLFGKIFPEVKAGGPVTYDMFAKAIAEFEFTLVFANAPLDRFARGQKNALTEDQKRGALLFFGSANCVACHAVAGQSNEMFSDFREHVLGVPQIAPAAGNPAAGNVTFEGTGQKEDSGLEEGTSRPTHRVLLRSSPIRNVVLQPALFHKGAYIRVEVYLRIHLNPAGQAPGYDPTVA